MSDFEKYRKEVGEIKMANKRALLEFNMVKYINVANTYRIANDRYLREGQILFNALYEIYPDIANIIRGSNLDPFYYEDGVRLEKFFDYLESIDK